MEGGGCSDAVDGCTSDVTGCCVDESDTGDCVDCRVMGRCNAVVCIIVGSAHDCCVAGNDRRGESYCLRE